MRLYKLNSSYFAQMLALIYCLLPQNASAHLIAITPVVSFPATVAPNSVNLASYKVSNLTSRLTLRVIDKSSLPAASGLIVAASTCDTPIAPGQSCTLTLQLNAPAMPQTIAATLMMGVMNSVDCVQLPLRISVANSSQLTVTSIAGPGGTVLPNTPQVVVSGGSLTFLATPSSSVTGVEWLLDGVVVATGTTFTLNNITANHSLAVRFLNFFAYVASENYAPTLSGGGSTSIAICPVTEGGASLGSCTPFNDSSFNHPIDIILNKTNTMAYIANSNNGVSDSGGLVEHTISYCRVNADGTLSSCEVVDAPGTDYTGLTLNAANNRLYYTDFNNDLVRYCTVRLDGSLSDCGMAASPTLPLGPDGRIAFNSTGTQAFVSQTNFTSGSTNYLLSCQVGTDGLLFNCMVPGFAFPTSTNLTYVLLGVTIDATNSKLYVANYEKQNANSYISLCTLSAEGVISDCQNDTGNATYNFSVVAAINTSLQIINNTTYLYVPNGAIPPSAPFPADATLSICPLLRDGSIGTCNSLTDPLFNSPMGVSIGAFSPLS